MGSEDPSEEEEQQLLATEWAADNAEEELVPLPRQEKRRAPEEGPGASAHFHVQEFAALEEAEAIRKRLHRAEKAKAKQQAKKVKKSEIFLLFVCKWAILIGYWAFHWLKHPKKLPAGPPLHKVLPFAGSSTVSENQISFPLFCVLVQIQSRNTVVVLKLIGGNFHRVWILRCMSPSV